MIDEEHKMTMSSAGRHAARPLLGIVALLIGANAAIAQNSDPVSVKLNGVAIHASDLAIAEHEIGGNLPPGATAQVRRDNVITFLSDTILLGRVAEQDGLAGSDEFKRRYEMMRFQVLREIELQKIAKAALADEVAMHKVYDDAVRQLGQQEEVHARHILVEKESQAKAIVAKLRKGADFDTLSKQESKDTAAAAQGGDLGYLGKDEMEPGFSDPVFKLEKGKFSEPVRSKFGWHIVKVDERRKKPIPTFDQARPEIEEFVVQRAQTEFIVKLRQSANIERVDAPAPPAAQLPAEKSGTAPKK
ncbi:MAG: peptidylprolyl isomerase [Tepidisphaerales bacterium]